MAHDTDESDVPEPTDTDVLHTDPRTDTADSADTADSDAG